LNARQAILNCRVTPYFPIPGNSSNPSWIGSKAKEPQDLTTIDLKLEYVDTASVQSVFDLMRMFKPLQEKSKDVAVNFYFEFDDPELLELGEIMEGRLGIKFNFIEYQ